MPLALLHLGDHIFAIVEQAKLRGLTSDFRQMVEITGARRITSKCVRCDRPNR